MLPEPHINEINMKKKITARKLSFQKITIHTLSHHRLAGVAGGSGLAECTTSGRICPSWPDETGDSCGLSCTCVPYSLDDNCGPGATALTRCATGGVCIPTYSACLPTGCA
jgi:hypothetical protein